MEMMMAYNENVDIAPITCLIKNPSLYPVVEDILSKKTFGHPSFGMLFQAIKDLNNRDTLADKFTLIVELELLGQLDSVIIPSSGIRGRDAIDYIANLPDVEESMIETYAYKSSRVKASRDLVYTYQKALRKLEEGGDSVVESVLSQVDIDTGNVAMMVGHKANSLKDSSTVATQVIDEYKASVSGDVPFIRTGIKAWDSFTNGIAKERLYIVSAVSNDGKSSLVQNVMYNISVKNPDGLPLHKGCLISLEASAQDVMRKMIQRITGISTLKIEAGDLSTEQESEMAKAIKVLGNSPLVFEDSSSLLLPLVRTKIRQAVNSGAEYIVIDQLEQISLGGAGDFQPEHIKLNFISYRIKEYAREMKVPIILVHQMNKGIDSGERRGKDVDPQMHDLAQAGQKAADAILMIRHKKVKEVPTNSYFWWVKNRQGKKGFMEVKFTGARILFEDMEQEQEELPEFLQNEFNEFEKQNEDK